LSLTRHSTHPLSVRLSESLGGRHFPEPVWSYLETPGSGIEGRVQGHELWLGSKQWIESRGVLTSNLPAATNGSVVHLAIDGTYRSSFTFSNTARPETSELIQHLGGQYELALLSGDNERERPRFQKLFGDDTKLHFNQSPLDKLSFIRRLQQAGKTVMMVGDGLNDAGALKQSDVGVAVVEKAGVFSPASDVIMTAAQFSNLDRMLVLARRSIRVVKWSFGISVLYNTVGVSLAAAGVLSPLICAVLMPLSSVSVVVFACGVTALVARNLRTTGMEVRL
jgi:P-type Cu+ transporter